MSAALSLGISRAVSLGNGEEGSTWEEDGEPAVPKEPLKWQAASWGEDAGCGGVRKLQGGRRCEEQVEMVENVLEGKRSKQGSGKQRLKDSICIVSGHTLGYG